MTCTRRIMAMILCGFALCSAGFPSRAEHPSSMAKGRLLRFESELIRLRLDPGDSLELEGHYRFSCSESTPDVHGLVYPFPADSAMGGVRVLELDFRRPGEDWRALDIEWAEPLGGILWRLPVGGADSCEVRVLYRQELLGTEARYIVTTTRGWDYPLREARFEAWLSPGMRGPTFSHDFVPCDSLGSDAYLFVAEDFWPEDDIVIRWKPKAD